MRDQSWLVRLRDEVSQAWAIAVKDVRVYYLTPPMLMFGLMMPIFLFLSFSTKRAIGSQEGISRLLAMTTFFTASSAGPVILPLERRARTYDRLLVAPMSLATLLLGKAMVGAFFAIIVSIVATIIGFFGLHVSFADVGLLAFGVVLASLAFSSFGLIFGSIPVRSVGSVMMPSTLIRWPLLFISGTFTPLQEMAPWARALSYLSPLTYAQDLMNHAVLGRGCLPSWVDVALLPVLVVVFLVPAARLHHRSRVLGY